jgi:hypothetical protein
MVSIGSLAQNFQEQVDLARDLAAQRGGCGVWVEPIDLHDSIDQLGFVTG